MIVGFTGTRELISIAQACKLTELLFFLKKIGYKELHHGLCKGADIAAHNIAGSMGFIVHAHPPTDKKHIGNPSPDIQYIEHEPKPYMARNKDIVNLCQVLIAVPNTMEEKLRSGTWATIREAKRQKKWNFIIDPMGRVK